VALTDQLMGKYLRDCENRWGILLIVHQISRPTGWRKTDGTFIGISEVVEHRTSNIEHRTSNIEHRTSNIEHRTSYIDGKFNRIQRPVCSTNGCRVDRCFGIYAAGRSSSPCRTKLRCGVKYSLPPYLRGFTKPATPTAYSH